MTSSNSPNQQERKKMPWRMRRAMLRRKGRTPSKSERAALMDMHYAMYAPDDKEDDANTPLDLESNVKDIVDWIEKEIEMADAKTPAKTTPEGMIIWTDPVTGVVNEIGPGVAKSYDKTKAFAEEQLWPNMPQKAQKDLFGINVCLLDFRRMTKGAKGMPPYFAVLAATEKDGVFTFLSSGEVVNRKLSRLFGIDSLSGEPNGYKNETLNEKGDITGVWITFVNNEGEGDYEGYFDIAPPIMVTAPGS